MALPLPALAIILRNAKAFGGGPFSFRQRLFLSSGAIKRILRELVPVPNLLDIQRELSRAGLGIPSNIFSTIVGSIRQHDSLVRLQDGIPADQTVPDFTVPRFGRPIADDFIVVIEGVQRDPILGDQRRNFSYVSDRLLSREEMIGLLPDRVDFGTSPVDPDRFFVLRARMFRNPN